MEKVPQPSNPTSTSGRIATANCQLLTANCLLPTAYCQLPINY